MCEPCFKGKLIKATKFMIHWISFNLMWGKHKIALQLLSHSSMIGQKHFGCIPIRHKSGILKKYVKFRSLFDMNVLKLWGDNSQFEIKHNMKIKCNHNQEAWLEIFAFHQEALLYLNTLLVSNVGRNVKIVFLFGI